MTTFTELTEKKLSDIFAEFSEYPTIAGFITNGFPIAISSYLKKSLLDNDSDYAELVIGGANIGELMKFILRVNKKGDSFAFIPEFEMGTAGKDFINLDEIEFDEETIANMSADFASNKEVITAFREAFEGNTYTDDGWVSMNPDEDEIGVTFDEENDISMSVFCVVTAIREVLCNNKDASSDIENDVAGLGKFKVSPVKNGYNTTLTFDKEFKSNCKSDKLADKFSEKA